MIILIYLPFVSKKNGGIYQYSLAALESLQKDKINTYYIFNEGEDCAIRALIDKSENFFLAKPKDVFRASKKNDFLLFLNKVIKQFSSRFYFNVIGKLDQFLIKNKVDILYSPFQKLPSVKYSKKICTMHDVQELHFPEFFSSKERKIRAIEFKDAIDNSNAVVVSFEHVKRDLIKYFGKPKEDIFTCLFDLNSLWFTKFGKSDLKKKENIAPFDSYILYPAATWEHKNHKNLLKAISIATKESGKNINLICTGTKTSFYDAELILLIEKLGLANNVSFLGIVDEQTLFSLYHYADAVIIPTFYEAGSFPLFESIVLGVPVICSNVTSLPETIKNDLLVFDPKNIIEIAQKIKLVCFDEDFREECKKNNLKRRDFFSRNNFLQSLLKVFEEVGRMKLND